MEITESTVYWITRLDGIHNFLISLCIITGILAVLSLIILFSTFMVCEGKEEFHKAMELELRAFFISIVLFVVFFLASVFIPTTKEMALIKILPAISNSKFMSEELPKDIREVYLMAKDAVKEKLVGEKK